MDKDRFEAVNKVGYEAYQLIEKHMRELGPMESMDLFTAVVGAANVCLANALRPGIEAGKGRAALADKLIASSMKHVRLMIERAIQEES
jgi:hypothetical protein